MSRPTGRRGIVSTREARTGWAFLLPFAVVFTLVFLAPIAYSIYLSAYQTPLIGGPRFVGFDNYMKLFSDDLFWPGFWRVVRFLLVQVPIMLLISLGVALAIDSGRLRARNSFRIITFLPYAVPAVVAALMWGFMYGTQFGLVGNINDYLGTNIPNPLSPDTALFAIGNIVTWSFVGYNMLIFYSALLNIPKELYEAADIDGANWWQQIRAIKIPAIKGSLGVAVIFSIIGSFQLFNEPNVLRSLAPNSINTNYTPNMYAYTLSFTGQQYNYAATVAIFMGVVTMILAYAVQFRTMRGK